VIVSAVSNATGGDAWNPAQYGAFADERARPFHDLLDLIKPAPMRRAVDLGCGTGELTALAADRFGIDTMLGLDTSAAMLAKAEAHQRAGLSFAVGDLVEWSSAGDHDLVLSNAALHWAPDHAAVLGRWTDALAPGGQLAVQMPSNADHPSHLLSVETAHDPEFAPYLDAAAIADPVADNVQPPQWYASLLFDLGFTDQIVRVQVYGPVLDHPAQIVEWTKGTSLTRFQKRLPPELFDEFIDRYRRRLVDALGDRTPYYYPFKRILFWARWPE
jgi:trans-aconitate 2-methyltransferase